MNVDRPSEYSISRKLHVEMDLRQSIRSEWPFVILYFLSVGFFAGQYLRIAVLGEIPSQTGNSIFVTSGLFAFGMLFWKASTLKTWFLLWRELKRLERSEQRLIVRER